MVEFDSAWNYISKDWGETFKFSILSFVLILIPVVGIFAFMGLTLKVIENSINKKKEIPDVFKDFGDNIIEGLKFAAFGIVLSIPFIIVLGLIAGGSIASIIAASTTNNPDTIAAASMGLFLTILPASLILGLLYAIITPGLICNYAKKREFGAFFDFSTALNAVKSNIGNFVLMIIFQMAYSILIGMVSSIISFTVIGPMIIGILPVLTSGKIQGEWFSETKT